MQRVKRAVSRHGIWFVLVMYACLAGMYSVVTPVMEASDELWHYPMVKYIADHHSLPVQDPQNVGPWRQEGSQPPLYYLLSAALTACIDTSDLPMVRYPNPHADNGIITQDGNVNLMVHGRADGFPWRGTTLAVHVIRFASVLMGVGTVYMGYRLVLEIWPQRTGLALAAAAITAFNPMFCFISGSVNNDNLAMLLGALGIWMIVRLVRRHGQNEPIEKRTWRRDALLLGVTLGLGVLTKTSVMGLLPLTALAVSYVAWRRRSWSCFLSGGLFTALPVLLISGWWFVRNALLYDGDWLGLERFILILGYRVPPATLRQLWGERRSFLMAYWGLFGGVNVPMPDWIYALLDGALIAAGIGVVVGGGRYALTWLKRRDDRARPQQVQVLLLALWPLIVLASWAGWATMTWSSQGRLVFTAITAWSAWMAWGLGNLVPRRWEWALPGALGAFMWSVAAWAPLGVIAPTYRPPLLPHGQVQPEHVLRANVGGRVRLLGYDIENTSARPGEAFYFTLYWESLRSMKRDWSIFCHILDVELELPIATRDRYPGEGLLATSMIAPGTRWADRYAVRLPDTVYAPAGALLEIGLYDLRSGERLPIEIEVGEGKVVNDALRFQPLRIEPRSGEVPNPVWVNFAGRLALVGWDVTPRVGRAGDKMTVTLHWECLSPMAKPCTASVQVVDAQGNKAAQADEWPGGVDTSHCTVGQRITDRRELQLSPDAGAGGYDLLIVVYVHDRGGGIRPLRLVHADGRELSQNSWVLGRVRVVAR